MTTRKSNPFFLTDYDSPENFCGREAELSQLSGALTNGRNLVLVSPRRMGKTGLIKHLFNQPDIKSNYYTIFVDIYATSCLKELVLKLSRAIFDELKPRGRKMLDGFFTFLSSLRPAFKIDANTGQPIFDIGLGEIIQPEISLTEIFSYLENANQPCIVAIDEFQQIGQYPETNTEAILRTHVQSCRNANFIFSGSQQHMMENMFFSAARPFYNSADYMLLSPIPIHEYIAFAKGKFESAGRVISPGVIEMAYNLLEGHSYYIQYVFNRLYQESQEGDSIEVDDVKSTILSILDINNSLYQNMTAMLSLRQKEVLIAIAKENKARDILSAEFAKRHSLHSPATVQSAIKRLVERQIVSRIDNQYSINDRFFGFWIRQSYTGTSVFPNP